MIDDERIAGWVTRFRFYRDPPDKDQVQAWLGQFHEDHRELAAKLLDNVLLMSERDIQQGYRQALQSIPGWHKSAAKREGNWRFLGFGRAGESGQAMLRLFREANDLASGNHDPLFCHLPDLADQGLTALDTVVFVDDFSGTGRQVCNVWPTIAEVIAAEANVFLVLTAITAAAATQIEESTGMQLRYRQWLGEDACIFGNACATFSAEEKAIVRQYGELADPVRPEGFGGSGLLLVLSHKTPNNTVPVLHVNEDHWRGLFPRYLRAA